MFESNPRGETIWAARNDYRLRIHDDGDGALAMVFKKVTLANDDKALYTLAFLMSRAAARSPRPTRQLILEIDA